MTRNLNLQSTTKQVNLNLQLLRTPLHVLPSLQLGLACWLNIQISWRVDMASHSQVWPLQKLHPPGRGSVIECFSFQIFFYQKCSTCFHWPTPISSKRVSFIRCIKTLQNKNIHSSVNSQLSYFKLLAVSIREDKIHLSESSHLCTWKIIIEGIALLEEYFE